MAKNGRYQALAVRIAAGETVRDSAAALGLGERTCYRMSRRPAFRRVVADLRTQATDSAVGALSESARGAVEVLSGIMHDSEQKTADRIAAAKSLLSLLGPVAELAELRARLDDIERRITEGSV